MNCRRCNNDRIASISGKCSDLSFFRYQGKEKEGYVQDGVGVGGGDYIELDWCLECGQIQDDFPMPDPELDQD